jgi:hypothetical protein
LLGDIVAPKIELNDNGTLAASVALKHQETSSKKDGTALSGMDCLNNQSWERTLKSQRNADQASSLPS